MQISWLIVLYGAELSFVSQNLKDKYYEYEKDITSRRFFDFVSILIMKSVVKRFVNNAPSISTEELAENNNIPIRLINDVVNKLVRIKLLIEIIDDQNQRTYMPAIDINKLTIGMVLNKIDCDGKENYGVNIDDEYISIWNRIKQIKSENHSCGNQLIKDL